MPAPLSDLLLYNDARLDLHASGRLLMSAWSVHSIAPYVGSLLGLIAMLFWRLSETRRPVTPRLIIVPPVAMSTGFAMFLAPAFRVPWLWALAAFVVGASVLAVPLVRTSELTREGSTVMLRRSRAFIGIILVLALVRYAARDYVGHLLPARQTAGMFFILAFGMILRWRAWMLKEYRRLTA